MSRRSHSPTRDRATPMSARVAALREGKELPVTRGDMLDIEVGQVPGPHVRAIMSLSSAINRSEGNRCSVSWEMQEDSSVLQRARHGRDLGRVQAPRLGALLPALKVRLISFDSSPDLA